MTGAASHGSGEGVRPARDLVAALTQGERDREVAGKTRKVVLASAGVLRQHEASRKRQRAVALAAILLVVVSLGPLIWMVVDFFTSGAHLGDITTQFSLWACILCPAIVAAALVGWLRRSAR